MRKLQNEHLVLSNCVLLCTIILGCSRPSDTPISTEFGPVVFKPKFGNVDAYISYERNSKVGTGPNAPVTNEVAFIRLVSFEKKSDTTFLCRSVVTKYFENSKLLAPQDEPFKTSTIEVSKNGEIMSGLAPVKLRESRCSEFIYPNKVPTVGLSWSYTHDAKLANGIGASSHYTVTELHPSWNRIIVQFQFQENVLDGITAKGRFTIRVADGKILMSIAEVTDRRAGKGQTDYKYLVNRISEENFTSDKASLEQLRKKHGRPDGQP